MENKQLWDSDGEFKSKPLRRPNEIPNQSSVNSNSASANKKSETSETTTEVKDFNDILNKSQLSVEAKEWYPSSYTQVTPQVVCNPQSAQSRLRRIRSDTLDDYSTDSSHSSSTSCFDHGHLDGLIEALIYDPGQFDNLIDNFLGLLEPHFEDVEVAIRTAEEIFGYALREPSFRYNAARLCCIIDEHCPLFRPRLHSLCQKELSSDKQRQGLTLFLAELYMQLHYGTLYGHCLLDSLKKLISSKKPDDIKSACQALKLAGYSLESDNKQQLDGIFEDLELTIPVLQQSVTYIVESVFTLRKNNWGRSVSTINTDSSQEQNGITVNSSDEEYILYGPDGQEITLEEQEFLCSNFEEADYSGDDPDDLYDPEPEMDKEIQEAFREFVKMGKR